MKSSAGHVVTRVLKITGISLGSILLLMALLPYLFPGFISTSIKKLANKTINGKLDFSNARLSFFKHFPALTLTIYDIALKGSAPFTQDTLLSANEVSFGVDLTSLFGKKISIDKIYLEDAKINIQADSNGNTNYNIIKSNPSSAAGVDSSNTSLEIEKILIRRSRLVYNDRSLPMRINAKGFYYRGTGDLSKAIFDLQTHMEADSLDFYYDNTPYFINKKLNADLITKINTKSLALLFENNNLRINNFPFQFKGQFEFLEKGYNMDFSLSSDNSKLHDILTALPPSISSWLSKTDVKGTGNIQARLYGKFLAQNNIMPALSLGMKIREGYIANPSVPTPISNLTMNLQAIIPNCNPDSINLRIDSLHFNMEKDFLDATIHSKGLSQPDVNIKLNAQADLEKIGKIFDAGIFAMKGKMNLHLQADGKYAKGRVQKGIRAFDTVVTSIPKFTLQAGMKDGYFKYASLPEPVKDISFAIEASCPDHDYSHAKFAIENIKAALLSNFVQGYARVTNAKDLQVDADLHSVLNMSDIKKCYPLDSMDLAGSLKVDIQSKGSYSTAQKLFPVTTATINLQDGSVKTKYYPHAIENIQVAASVVSSNGSLKDLQVNLTPVSFQFEGQPFKLKASLKDFNNLQYDISSNGTIDLGKIYKLFAVKGYDAEGFIKTNLYLHGRQSDAMEGHLDRLSNSGTMRVKNISLTADLFPKPFYIKEGLFRFTEDKMWFDAFKANYGQSSVTLNGYVANMIGYLSQGNGNLNGTLELKSDRVVADELMAFADGMPTQAADSTHSTAAPQTGVMMVPQNLSVSFNADVKSVLYNGLELKDCKGQMTIDSGQVKLTQTGFIIVDAPVVMDATYKSLSPQKAIFDYHITVSEFDIQKAYRQIKLFHDMASAASKASGTVSLDYQLSGRLDGNMHPVYPSLKGGGVLSLKKIKVKGLKLFGAVSQESGKDINDPDLSKVDIKTHINNNIITIDRTRMRIAGFRPRIEGQVSMDGRLNLKFRLGLPPFGVIGIPMTVTGTQENPQVKMGRGKKNGDLEETEDKDDSEKDQ